MRNLDTYKFKKRSPFSAFTLQVSSLRGGSPHEVAKDSIIKREFRQSFEGLTDYSHILCCASRQ
jgi:hypothetical protein